MGKRVYTMVLSVLMLLLCACGMAQEKEPAVFPEESAALFKIVELRESGFLGVRADSTRQELIFVSLHGTVCYGEKGETVTVADLRPGMAVTVYWDGMIMESYPGQIAGVTALQVAEQQDDLVGLYRRVLHELWENDPALNQDAVLLGLDFSGVTHLSEGEKTALAYLFSCDVGLGLQYVTGTWQQLGEQGYIDTENLYWEDGVFLSLSVTEEGNGRFTFEAEKWRSGTGAIWFKCCTAKQGKAGQWNYEMGGMAIS